MNCPRWRCLTTALPPPPPTTTTTGPSARFFSCCPARYAVPGNTRNSRGGSDSSSSSSNHVSGNQNPQWPQLKRKPSPLADSPVKEASFGLGQLIRRTPRAEPRQTTQLNATSDGADSSSAPLVTSDRGRLMLVLDGLSPNLKASDFHRLLPSQLSSWSVIKRVQQKRCPKTLEPLGRYYITFTSESMLSTYRDKFLRLHGLNKHRLLFADELLPEKWELSAPSHLRSGSDDLAEEANTLTFAPGSLNITAPRRRRAGVRRNWWAQQLGARLEQFGYGPSPPTVMLHVQPPTLTARDIAHLIHEDGCNRGCPWDVCEPLPLATAEESNEATATEELDGQRLNSGLNLAPKGIPEHQHDQDVGETPTELNEYDDILYGDDSETGKSNKSGPPINYILRERQRSRFIVVCADEGEAYRFQRNWNQRMLTGMPEHDAGPSLVHASRINW
ncbi:hypothetical protein HJFPF1_06297 [Paramyrothecium foliicola]|nr:hypothetical protein HJFPF1_06297 [Paramyrothecium foliicola]